jgi:creatine kinase
LEGLQLNPSISKDARREVERVGVKALVQLCDEFQGDYFPLLGSKSYVPKPGGMSEEEEDQLISKGYLFEEPDSTLQLSTGVGRHWPDARGVFVNSKETCMVWINEEEHLKLTTQQASSDVKETFTQFCRLEAALADLMRPEGYSYMCHERLGFLSAAPSNLGTGMRLSVFAKLPLLTAHPDFKDMCKSLGITLRTVTGMDTISVEKEEEHFTWELSNNSSLGTPEVELVNALIAGCAWIIDMEMKLEKGEEVVVPGLGDEEFPGFPVENAPSCIPDLSSARSIMADVLKENPGIYDSLKDKVTGNGVTFAKTIKPGIDCKPVAAQGVVAGDAESYDTFSELFDPVIAKYHKSLPPATFEHPSDLNSTNIVDKSIDPSGKYVVSTSVRIGRNLANLCLLPSCTDNERREVERVSTKALLQMDGGSQGDYLPLAGSTSYIPKVGGMQADEEASLRRYDLAFAAPKDALQLSSGFGKNWPDARGVFLCSGKECGVWINEKEHLVFFASQRNGDIKEAFKVAYSIEGAFKTAIENDGYEFASSSRLGYISATPAGLGTGMQTKALLKLPLLSAKPDFKNVCLGLSLEVGSFKMGGVEVCSSLGLGKTEVQQLNAFILGCGKLIEAEQALETSS